MITTAIADVLASYKITTNCEADGALQGELAKPDGTTYQTRVAGQFSRDACTCPGFPRSGKCKHVEALRELRFQTRRQPQQARD